MAGPLLIYLYTILIAVVFIILFTSSSSQVVFVLEIHLAILIFFNFMDIKSNVKDNVGLADFKLIKNLNENDCFICFLFHENIYLGIDFHRKIRENSFLREKFIKELDSRYKIRNLSRFTVSILTFIIIDLTEDRIDISNASIVEKYIEYVIDNKHLLPDDDINNKLLCSIIRYYIVKKGNIKEAKYLYNSIENKLISGESIYIDKQMKNLFDIEGNQKFLEDPTNYIPLGKNCRYFSGVYNRLLKDNNLKINIE